MCPSVQPGRLQHDAMEMLKHVMWPNGQERAQTTSVLFKMQVSVADCLQNGTDRDLLNGRWVRNVIPSVPAVSSCST